MKKKILVGLINFIENKLLVEKCARIGVHKLNKFLSAENNECYFYIAEDNSFSSDARILNGDLLEVIKSSSITDFVIPCICKDNNRYIRWCENRIGNEWNITRICNSWHQRFTSYSVNFNSLKTVHLFSLDEDLIKNESRIDYSYQLIYRLFQPQHDNFIPRNEMKEYIQPLLPEDLINELNNKCYLYNLYEYCMNPKISCYYDEKYILIQDQFPKSYYHYLLIPRPEYWNIPMISLLKRDDLNKLKEFHMFSRRICKSLIIYFYENFGLDLRFRIGYHSIPSQRPIHMHIISTDYDGVKMNKKIKWNKFNSPFFIDSDVLEESFECDGRLINYNENEKYLNDGFYCYKCDDQFNSLDDIKNHLSVCSSVSKHKIYSKDNIEEDVVDGLEP